MSAILIEMSGFIILLIAAAYFLNRLVRELDPQNRGTRIIFLSLGTGVFAFGLKIALIILFSSYSESMLAMLPKFEVPGPGESEEPADNTRYLLGPYTWEALPSSAPHPPDNLPSAEKSRLGKKLFYEKGLSWDYSVSCASCHDLSLKKAGADGLPTSIGIKQIKGSRNAPTIINAAFQKRLFWDGRAVSLEQQARAPLINPIEMGMPSLQSVVERIQNLKSYRQDFARVFGADTRISIDQVTKALAAYERTLITPNSDYDRLVLGDSTALTDNQIRGMALFESMGCVHCHSGPNFSDASIFGSNPAYRIFPANPDPVYERKYHFGDDPGLVKSEYSKERSSGVWRIPPLRNVALTAPYFHNGAVDSLAEAVRIMARVQLNKKISDRKSDDESYSWSKNRKQLLITTNVAISEDEVESLVAFLESLNGDITSLKDQ